MSVEVISSSYGNDSVALIQWAYEQGLRGVKVVFIDTGWAGEGWMERVERCEAWVRTLGFEPIRIVPNAGTAECLKRLVAEWREVLASNAGAAPAPLMRQAVASVASNVDGTIRVNWMRPERVQVGSLLYCIERAGAAKETE